MPKIQRGSCIRLDSSSAVRSAFVWQHVANTGKFLGYGGGPFEFDRATFENIVARFRESPAYCTGPDGIGAAPVTPWDIAHLSERADSHPDGHRAVGWITELDIRSGAAVDQLWARTIWNDDMRTQVMAGAFRFASVVVDFNAIDSRTASPLGPMLLSVAATNQPFISGLAPLVAASRSAAPLAVVVPRPVRVGIDISRSQSLVKKLEAARARASVGVPASSPTVSVHATAEEAELIQTAQRQSHPRAPLFDATLCSGRNQTERALRLMRSKFVGFASKPWAEQVHQASEAVAAGIVRDESNMTTQRQSEAFWGSTSTAPAAPSPPIRIGAPPPDAVFDGATSAEPVSKFLDPLDRVGWNVAHGRTVALDAEGTLIETTSPPEPPRAPEPPPPGLQRVQALVTQQGERALADRRRAIEAHAFAELERDRAAAIARDAYAVERDGLALAEAELSAARAIADAGEREWQRIKTLQRESSAALVYDRLAALDAAQSDEAWAGEKESIERSARKVAQQLAKLMLQQRERATELQVMRSQGQSLSRELELDWRPGRHDARDRRLLLAAAFRRALIDSGISAADLATLTR